MATPSWERIVEVYDPDGELRTTTDRMAVPGGWIYRELTQEGVALVFVPVEHVKRGYVIYDNITDEFFTGFDADEEWSWSHKESDITAAALYSCKDDASAAMRVMSRKFQENGHKTDFAIRWHTG